MVASWCLTDESHPDADTAQVRIANEDAITSAIFWFEVRNVLLTAERRGRITDVQTATILASIADLPIQEDRDPDEKALLRLARKHRLSVYDAAYLELAKRKAFPLATLDKALIGAAKSEKLLLVGAGSIT